MSSRRFTHIVLLQDLQGPVDIVERVNASDSSLQPHLHTHKHGHTTKRLLTLVRGARARASHEHGGALP